MPIIVIIIVCTELCGEGGKNKKIKNAEREYVKVIITINAHCCYYYHYYCCGPRTTQRGRT